MLKVSERTHVMKENFMPLHLEGSSIPEIASRYNLSQTTVYRHLQDIANAHGVSRESLLQRIIVRIPTTDKQYAEEERKMKVTAEELDAAFTEANVTLTNLINLIDKVLMEEI